MGPIDCAWAPPGVPYFYVTPFLYIQTAGKPVSIIGRRGQRVVLLPESPFPRSFAANIRCCPGCKWRMITHTWDSESSFAGLLLSSLSQPLCQRRRLPAHWCQLSSSQRCHLAPCQRTAWCSSSRRPCHCPSSRPWCAPCETMHCLFACLALHLAEKGCPL